MSEEGGNKRALTWAAMALFIGLPFAALALIPYNLVRMAEADALADGQEVLLRQLEARLAQGGAREGGLGDTSAIYLKGVSRPLAGAELQQLLVGAIERAGARLIEVQGVEDAGAEGEAGDDVRLRVTLDAKNAGVLALLHELETGLPLLTLQEVHIRQLPSPGGESDEDPLLRVDFVVQGHWRPATG